MINRNGFGTTERLSPGRPGMQRTRPMPAIQPPQMRTPMPTAGRTPTAPPMQKPILNGPPVMPGGKLPKL